MSIATTVLNLALDRLAAKYPAEAGLIAAAKRLEPAIEASGPLIRDAISEGPAAFAAAKEKAPELFADLETLASNLKGTPDTAVSDHDLAVLSAHVVGAGPPGWTDTESQNWLSRAQGDH